MKRGARTQLEHLRRESGDVENALIDDFLAGETDRRGFLQRATLFGLSIPAIGVALEALGTLSGADRAVTNVVPVIDEFRFGSAYSSRTGRTEPTVTIGKRLTERVRANVTTGLAESREVRSNIEWRLSNRVSVESSYDNVNDISASALGNLGAGVRWRLEFE